MRRVAGCLLVAALATTCSRSTLSPSLGDREYWTLVTSLSEPPGRFDVSENLVSNEPLFVENVRRLRAAGGVYIGVGPEQNFSYIARLRPAMAFVVDIRRENLNLHLLYKALFELAPDRAEFVSRLFSRPRPAGLNTGSSVDDIFSRYDGVMPSRTLHEQTRSAVRERLIATHGFELTDADLESIDRAFTAFYTDGPAIDFWRGRPKDPEAVRPSYRQLMTARDVTGSSRSYLASEDQYAFVRGLQTRNLIVPVVGDFGGPSALRRVGEYVRSHRARVSAFYASNVAVYLTNEQTRTFCATLATLPADARAKVVDREDVRPLSEKLESCRAGQP